eukprot:944319-Amphidinium_carterae.3
MALQSEGKVEETSQTESGWHLWSTSLCCGHDAQESTHQPQGRHGHVDGGTGRKRGSWKRMGSIGKD